MSSETVIATRALTKRYGRVVAVDGLELNVQRGEVYGFLGRNGAGKTTAIRMLLGLVHPTAGVDLTAVRVDQPAMLVTALVIECQLIEVHRTQMAVAVTGSGDGVSLLEQSLGALPIDRRSRARGRWVTVGPADPAAAHDGSAAHQRLPRRDASAARRFRHWRCHLVS